MLNAPPGNRRLAASPFALTGTLAILAGGSLAAAAAHAPVPVVVWMVAYLVLVAGVAQVAFGAGQAMLAAHVPTGRWLATQWSVFNLGNAGVMAGTLCTSFVVVCISTLCFAAAIALFLWGVRSAPRRPALLAYRALLALVFLSSLVGLGLSAGR